MAVSAGWPIPNLSGKALGVRIKCCTSHMAHDCYVICITNPRVGTHHIAT